jgi:hypothetical protein
MDISRLDILQGYRLGSRYRRPSVPVTAYLQIVPRLLVLRMGDK